MITAVVCASFDEASDTAVLAVRERVAALGVRLPARPRHRPHLTLAAVRTHEQQLGGVVDLMRPIAAAQPAIAVTLGRIGTFGRAGALWLGPDDPTDLRTLQRSVRAEVEAGPWPEAFGGRSRPEQWVPHCSLATRLDRRTLEAAKSAISEGYSPIDATVTGLAVIVVGGPGDVEVLRLVG